MLRVRSLADVDAAWLDGWFATIAASVGYREMEGGAASLAERLHEGAVHARVIVRDDVRVGLAVYRIDAPRAGAAIIEIVAVPAEYARRGSGMSAVALVEDELRSAGVGVVYAPSAAIHGIATYFWIRLGYGPLLRPEWPCERSGVAWLMRTL